MNKRLIKGLKIEVYQTDGYDENWKPQITYYVGGKEYRFPLTGGGYCPVIDGVKFSSKKKGAEYLLEKMQKL